MYIYCSIPPVTVLKDILSVTPTVTFYGFLVALSKSEAIDAGIGRNYALHIQQNVLSRQFIRNYPLF